MTGIFYFRTFATELKNKVLIKTLNNMEKVIFEVYDKKVFFNACKLSGIKVQKYNEELNYYICNFNEYITIKENTNYCVSLPFYY